MKNVTAHTRGSAEGKTQTWKTVQSLHRYAMDQIKPRSRQGSRATTTGREVLGPTRGPMCLECILAGTYQGDSTHPVRALGAFAFRAIVDLTP